jgi:membrane-associated phospholipid phosphatase
VTDPASPQRRTILAAALAAAGSFAVLMIAVQAGYTGDLDSTGRTAAAWSRAHDLVPFLHFIEVAFAEPFMIVYAVALVVTLLLLRAPRAAATVAVATSLTPIATGLLKDLVARDRPTWQVADHALSTPAFPSGHASSTVALVGALIVSVVAVSRSRQWHRSVFVIVTVVGLAVVVLVGADRVLLGRHYPTDVLGGALLGAAVVLIVAGVLGGTGTAFRLASGAVPHAGCDNGAIPMRSRGEIDA